MHIDAQPFLRSMDMEILLGETGLTEKAAKTLAKTTGVI